MDLDLEAKYAINGAICIVCRTIVFTAFPTDRRVSSLAVSKCAAIDDQYHVCDGKVEEIEPPAVEELFRALAEGLTGDYQQLA